MSSDPMRRCPFCAEWIQPLAVICRFCQRQVEPVRDVPTLPDPDPSPDRLPGISEPPRSSDPPTVEPLDLARREALENHYGSLSEESLEKEFGHGPEGFQHPEIWRIVESVHTDRIQTAERTAASASAALQQAQSAHAVEPIEPGVKCINHAAVEASHLCRYCKAGICETCTFSFPGELHLCPACATKQPAAMTEKRRFYLIWSYVGALVTTVAIAFSLTGVQYAGSQTQSERESIDTLIGGLWIAGIMVGLVCGSLARPRGSPSPGAVRGALVWNWVLAGILLLLIIVGLTTK